eukprot:TRINITY_DN1600_c0_g2_i2.p1 TRINITY_DN1600_c0_g2~~TRINITY_DN1600_c0_g2_i2.p1  ORF type:complete len:308 (-),score=-32.21 TRINITY_DN1600_c0_g2_i2:582-1505(-)
MDLCEITQTGQQHQKTVHQKLGRIQLAQKVLTVALQTRCAYPNCLKLHFLSSQSFARNVRTKNRSLEKLVFQSWGRRLECGCTLQCPLVMHTLELHPALQCIFILPQTHSRLETQLQFCDIFLQFTMPITDRKFLFGAAAFLGAAVLMGIGLAAARSRPETKVEVRSCLSVCRCFVALSKIKCNAICLQKRGPSPKKQSPVKQQKPESPKRKPSSPQKQESKVMQCPVRWCNQHVCKVKIANHLCRCRLALRLLHPRDRKLRRLKQVSRVSSKLLMNGSGVVNAAPPPDDRLLQHYLTFLCRVPSSR